MTCEIFLVWLKKLDQRIKLEQRHVLLILGNAAGHAVDALNDVTIQF